MRRHGQAVTRFTRRQVMFEPEYVMFRTGQEIGFAEARLAQQQQQQQEERQEQQQRAA